MVKFFLFPALLFVFFSCQSGPEEVLERAKIHMKKSEYEFNKKDFKCGEGITARYINPVDSKSDMEKYLKKFHVPFPVVAEAKSLGKSYGVSGYPTFFLVDEQGVIEKVKAGYQEEFFRSLKNNY